MRPDTNSWTESGKGGLSAIFRGNSTFLYSGGVIGDGVIDQTRAALAFDEAGVLADASSFASVFAYDNAVIDFVGYGLTATLLEPNYQGTFSAYQLTGTLADGTVNNGGTFYTQNGSGARYQLTLAPEPTMSAELLLAATCCAGRSRRRAPIPSSPSSWPTAASRG